MTPLRVVALLILAVAVTACPRRVRRTPSAPEIPTDGDADARQRFQEERSRFERDDVHNNAGQFEAIAREYPDDPIAPHALFYAGRAAFRADEFAAAMGPLQEALASEVVDESLRRRVQLYLGLCLGYLGRHAEALELLQAAGDASAVTDGERAERFAGLAEAATVVGDVQEALHNMDRWFGVASPSERAYIVARVRVLVEQLEPVAVSQLHTTLQGGAGPAALFLTERLAGETASAGNTDYSAQLWASARQARVALELPSLEGASVGGGDPRLLGAVLPLSGRRARVGAAAIGGLAVAAGVFESGANEPLGLTLRDSTSTAPAAADAIDSLVDEGVIAVVGPLDVTSSRAAAVRAATHGVPMLSLAPAEADSAPSPFVFHVALSPAVRARALARAAYRSGARRFAVLGPESNYGRTAAAAFRGEVEALGGTLVAEAWYPRSTTSFAAAVGKIRGKPFDALFVPDTARRLELIVPALAAANLQVRPAGAAKPRVGRPIRLLATAEGLDPGYLRASGRYSHGALLAPGFYPDAADPIIAGFAEQYQAAYGRSPTYLDAYAYDATLVVKDAIRRGARNRTTLTSALAATSVRGLTGTVQFDANRRRGDSGLLFQVERDVGGQYVIRAKR